MPRSLPSERGASDTAGKTNGSTPADGKGSGGRGKGILLRRRYPDGRQTGVQLKTSTCTLAAALNTLARRWNPATWPSTAREWTNEKQSVHTGEARTHATTWRNLHANVMLRERDQTQRATHRTMYTNIQKRAVHRARKQSGGGQGLGKGEWGGRAQGNGRLFAGGSRYFGTSTGGGGPRP